MKTLAMIPAALILLAAAAAPVRAQSVPKIPAWKEINRGVRWEKSLDDARKRASHEGKPVLLFQLVGDLDKEGC